MEEEKPLIEEEDDDLTGTTADIKRLIRRHRDRHSEEQLLRHDPFSEIDEECESKACLEDGDAPDNVTCVFVIAFDTRHGRPSLMSYEDTSTCRCSMYRVAYQYW